MEKEREQTWQGHRFFLQNEKMKVAILDFGARIQSLWVKDRNGKWQDVVLGYDTLQEYEHDDAYFGALIGRCAGRIQDGYFDLAGKRYPLAKNNGTNHLHGGERGFSFRFFQVISQSDTQLTLRYTSPNMEEGYPGTLQVEIRYILEKNRLRLEYEASSDQLTIVNLTNHSYFNLHGAGKGSVDSHQLYVSASSFYPNNEAFLPDHEAAIVSPFDFRKAKHLYEIFSQIEKNAQLKQANGIDHYFRFSKQMTHRVEVYEPATGIHLCMESDQPGVQIYTPYYQEKYGKERNNYAGRPAIALEPQKRSNSIHGQECEVLLEAGQPYRQTTVYTFTTDQEDNV